MVEAIRDHWIIVAAIIAVIVIGGWLLRTR
jgi:hypothetical protein